MISPQSIAVGAASVGLVGKESDLFRFTVKHSFIMLAIICIITLMEAYVIKWIIPKYKILEGATTLGVTNVSKGFLYLLILTGILIAIAVAIHFKIRVKDVRAK